MNPTAPIAKQASEGIETYHMRRKGRVNRPGGRELGRAGEVRRAPVRGRPSVEWGAKLSCAYTQGLQHNRH